MDLSPNLGLKNPYISVWHQSYLMSPFLADGWEAALYVQASRLKNVALC